MLYKDLAARGIHLCPAADPVRPNHSRAGKTARIAPHAADPNLAAAGPRGNGSSNAVYLQASASLDISSAPLRS